MNCVTKWKLYFILCNAIITAPWCLPALLRWECRSARVCCCLRTWGHPVSCAGGSRSCRALCMPAWRLPCKCSGQKRTRGSTQKSPSSGVAHRWCQPTKRKLGWKQQDLLNTLGGESSTFSKTGTNSGSKMSLGTLPTNTSQPLEGCSRAPQFGGGP